MKRIRRILSIVIILCAIGGMFIDTFQVFAKTGIRKFSTVIQDNILKNVDESSEENGAIKTASERKNMENNVEQTEKEEDIVRQNQQEEKKKTYTISDFPIIEQMPELPTGCEITALTMVLNYYGYSVDKMQMATEYLPVLASSGKYVGSDNRTYGNDMNQYFIGDPTTENGIICGTKAIVTAANDFLTEQGSSLYAVDKTGISIEELYQLTSENIPVVVWCTIGMENRRETQGWYTENGDYVEWSSNDHGAVLIGYDSEQVVIADPLAGLMKYNRQQFESVFESRGNKCVVLIQ